MAAPAGRATERGARAGGGGWEGKGGRTDPSRGEGCRAAPGSRPRCRRPSRRTDARGFWWPGARGACTSWSRGSRGTRGRNPPLPPHLPGSGALAAGEGGAGTGCEVLPIPDAPPQHSSHLRHRGRAPSWGRLRGAENAVSSPHPTAAARRGAGPSRTWALGALAVLAVGARPGAVPAPPGGLGVGAAPPARHHPQTPAAPRAAAPRTPGRETPVPRAHGLRAVEAAVEAGAGGGERRHGVRAERGHRVGIWGAG